MDESSKMNQNPTNDSDNFEPDLKTGVQHAAVQDSLSRGNTKTKVTESSRSQRYTKRQQSKNKMTRSSRQQKVKTSSEETVRITRSASRKARSETGFLAVILLPTELWLMILKHCVSASGTLPFLLRAARVCRTWRDLTMKPILWEKLDLTCEKIKQSQEFLEWLVHTRLSGCKEIILDDWGCETNDAVELIAKHCPWLQTVNLLGSRQLSDRGVVALFENCQNLRNLGLSCTWPSALSSIVGLLKKGFQRSLECLNLSGHELDHLSTNFEGIVDRCGVVHLACQHQNMILRYSDTPLRFYRQNNCPQLKELRLGKEGTKCKVLIIDPVKLQTSCPLLRVLDFVRVSLYIQPSSQEAEVQAQTDGLVHLQELRCGRTEPCPFIDDDGMLDSILPRLLHNSTQLKVLDLSGHPEFSPSVLLPLPVKALEQLNLSRTDVTKQELTDIFLKWRHSLTRVFLDEVNLDSRELKAALKVLTDLPTCPVRELSLSFCRTSLSCVRMLTGNLKNLEDLQLEYPDLPEDINQRHEGRLTLERLHEHLCQLEDVESDNEP